MFFALWAALFVVGLLVIRHAGRKAMQDIDYAIHVHQKGSRMLLVGVVLALAGVVFMLAELIRVLYGYLQ